MPTTDPSTGTPAVPLGNHPAYPTAELRPDAGRRLRVGLAVTVTVVAVAVTVGLLGVTALGAALSSAPPDVSRSIDPIVARAALTTLRSETSGSPAFGHEASVSVDLLADPGAAEPPCVAVFRAVAALGFTATGGSTAGSCTAAATVGTDVVRTPDGGQVQVWWDATSVGLEVDDGVE